MLPEQQTFLSLPSSVCNSQINRVAKFLISIVAFCTEEFKAIVIFGRFNVLSDAG